ncbi:MAG: metallophosphoesterase family protein [Planctomycetes bacterium]|nr:metallophosphoesterase family protein [Planctomycetota bacterium]
MIAGFEFGARAPLLVRRECVVVEAAPPTTWRLIYASDLHLTARREHVGAALVEAVAGNPCDVVLLGGDLLEQRSGADLLEQTVQRLAAHAPVFAVAGNHDGWLGKGLARAAVRAGGGHWLHEAEVELVQAGARLQLHAALRPRSAADAASVRVLVGHDPKLALAAAPYYDLVLAGHLHGGQCVWWQRGAQLYPGAWFSRWNGLRYRVGNAVLLVSRGVADTVPVRFRCPREVLACEVGGLR